VMGGDVAPGADGLVHEPIADVFLNSCLHAELDAMARIAERVAPQDAPRWQQRRDALAARIREAMWNDEVGAFFPVVRRDLCAAQPHYVRHTPAMLMPLWAGVATEEQARETVLTLLGRRRGYPQWDGAMTVRTGTHLHGGVQIVSDGLHPSRGGVQRDAEGGLLLRFPVDRNPAQAYMRLQSTAPITVIDGRGDERRIPGDAGWIPGIRELRCDTAEVTVRWSRMHHEGLLSPYGIKSAHPLDGKHPAPHAAAEFWSGTVWAPHQLHTCQALLRHGERDLALAIARAFCDAVATSYAAGGDAFEHISHEDGRGLGVGGYTWTAAVALMLMEELLDGDA
jgi:Trehalase